MADTKITDLTAITGANTATGDLFVTVDISDTTMAASGTDKKITRAELLNALATSAAQSILDDTTVGAIRATLLIAPPTQQVLTVGSGTYNLPTNCTAIIVEVVAGGGGGGGVTGHASQAAIGTGGSAGGYARKLITSPSSTYAYTVGAGGTGGAAGSNNGNNGNDSTWGSGGGLITAKAGSGGVTFGTGTSVVALLGGAGAAVSTGGDINTGTERGGAGQRNSATNCHGGGGGSSYFGGGGSGAAANADGNDATGPGSGGSGGYVASVNTSRAGGDGADGVIVVTEFYG